ncbi:MAG: hypothetical protein PF549_03235 [Patescibacteria group bacterium]|jgi:hypothetical protein|nr:hypothetical protein [Patescibacteria group bacterium]
MTDLVTKYLEVDLADLAISTMFFPTLEIFLEIFLEVDSEELPRVKI